MYLSFYGLRKQPFHVTPDPEFLYLSHSHKEALAAIIYGIAEKKGFVAITGPVGVGKTTILRSYLESTTRDKLKIVYIFNAKLTFESLLKTIYQELGAQLETTDTVEMVNRLYETLIEEYKVGNTVVLVVDEAQNMPIDTLESLRMISNLETSRDKLIQIVLVGQPEFEETLNSNRLRQLKQRIAVRAVISPFTKDESIAYIKFRLQKANCQASSVFTQGALKRIAANAHGIPRTINILCDNALITGFGYEKKPVTKRIVREIIRDFEGSGERRVARWIPWSAAALALALLVFVFGWYFPQYRDALFAGAGLAKSSNGQTRPAEASQPAEPPNAGLAAERLAATGKDQIPSPDQRRPSGVVTKTVSRGDTLLALVREVYGVEKNDPRIPGLFAAIRQQNPRIKNTDVILTDQLITFPDLESINTKQ